MLSIITNQTIQECSRLEKQVSELSGQVVELEQVIKGLNGLSGMEEPIARLTHQFSEMEFQHIILKQMMLALNKSILSYMNCENWICDNGDQNAILYARQEIGINDLSGISNILSGL